ncbi:MAG: hypothetical protein Q8868_04305 [Bacteroidota bacterium]|nr:hypothetical protein [Bacteroidota bacterium]
MYHVLATGLTSTVLYLLSYFFYRNRFYSLQFHRKLWNSILAVVFILTASAGLFLALQVNYKWNIPVTKTILKWHVESGIGLAFAGIFHFIWHFTYYMDFFRRQKSESSAEEFEARSREGDLAINLFIVGFVSSSVQLLFMKEIMNITGGYELITGIFLCSWLLGSAAGARVAPASQLTSLRKINLFFTTGPLISLFLMMLLSRLFMKTGETPSFLAGAAFTFLVLLPFCMISGFTFIKLIAAAQGSVNFIPGRSFSIETIGGITAGIVVSLLSSGILNTYQTLLAIITLGISYTLLTFYIRGKTGRFVIRILMLLIVSALIIFSPDIIFRQLLLRGIRVTATQDTPYGNITEGLYQGEVSTFYDQKLLTFSNDAIESEEDIHYALLQNDKPEDILLISGSTESRIKEIKKYSPKRIVFVERDPALAKIETGIIEGENAGLTVENDDAFRYITKTNRKFDAIIMLLSPPSSLLLNRFYTLEFFQAVKKAMNSDGVFSCAPGINPNYFNREAVLFYSSIFNGLKKAFRNVIPIAGNKIYFIASDQELSSSICMLAAERNIVNSYVGPDYLSDDLIKAKSDEITALIDSSVRLNRTAMPVACFYYQAFNLTKNIGEKIPALVLLLLLFVISLTLIRGKSALMYFSASALAGYEIIMLLVLQLTAGNMYQLTGLIIAGLMAGLAIGSGICIRFPDKLSMGIKVLILIVFYIMIAVSTQIILGITSRFLIISVLILSGFVPAIITGNIFRELTRPPMGRKDTSIVYSSDLAGSAIGFIVFSGIAVPLTGIIPSLFILPVLILTGFVFLIFSTRRRI